MERPALTFVTLDGDPSQVAANDSIRKLVRSNATSSRSISRHEVNTSVMQLQGHDPSEGRSRFALVSRKPMKRARRKAVSNSGGVEVQKQAPLLAGRRVNKFVSDSQQCHLLGLPGRMTIRPTYLSAYMPVITKAKVSTMTQHCQWPLTLQLAAVKMRDPPT